MAENSTAVGMNNSTKQALESRALAPRFYTTDCEEIGRYDIDPVREEWDAMMAAFELDTNREHFKQNYEFDPETLEADPELKAEFLDLLVSSITAEYSGCVLYQEIESKVGDPEIAQLFRYMARDESRHAGFINRALNKLGVAVDLSVLKRDKEYTYFRPKFIFYATYLSEKIGYARYITIYRHLERHPERRFHPIFKWFLEWCNDEFAHGEAFALLMRANPKLLTGYNKLFIRMFLVLVYTTMYVRDHSRPKLYEAFGMDVTEFDHTVFDITTEISKQVFPMTLNTRDPKFQRGLERLLDLNIRLDGLRGVKGIGARLQRLSLQMGIGTTILRLFLLPTIPNQMPKQVAMQPAWYGAFAGILTPAPILAEFEKVAEPCHGETP